MDIYKDLPRTNCGDCGRGSCFAFATAVYLEAFPLDECPHLAPTVLNEMRAKLEAGRDAGEGRRPSSTEQALRSLLATVEDVDLEVQAARCGGSYSRADSDGAAARGTAQADESVVIDFLDGSYRVAREDVTALRGEAPTVWVKILLLIYLTRAGGKGPTGTWTAYRDLPNSVSKARSFDECAAKIAYAFEGDVEGLERAAVGLGARASEPGSADRAFVFPALPMVPVRLLFWDREEEFPARVSLLLDGSVLDYLDLEALLFVGEVLAGRLLGERFADVVA